ncbi:hypothetical protein A2454_06485 [Candidatus Peribacteria bacterium RIFOXYC2_FULL_55_14]|nr:MAG: TPR domain protein [Candidatus Peribacteria bacterium GW2011_GWB1_54_5]KKW40736.1 MAG: TPR domain protein [Candidatus Peribacteria bacterium GW2011_GWC2_54_8]OGJ70752.1 MAG: hypothetical protein A2198_02475 [Candidatus Peribacteria bacterium RIFOXYA1_FULL_56_14]OGJ74170.1 MAG: hypothetical protein A2217_00845 [Candidatus Peribacteria bacterium RIFOXYA2_FULL_55_28]OGJ75601.1 MAG: hypothetical protein A2384_01805 [Candidatus Peribacteria bacterium RIFOXYB1_FULL_54_35]OGJ76223.1 MAG: hypo
MLTRLKEWRFLPVACIILACLLVYLQAAGFEFLLFDDELLIIDNPKIRGLTFTHLLQIFTTYDPELYIPLTLLTHQIEYTLFKLNPAVYHLTNILLHTGNAVLVYCIFTKLLNRKAALIAGLLFALHPINAEAVAWASARKDLLASFFFLLALLGYLTSWKKLSLLSFLCGLLSKVSIAPLPVILLIIDWLNGVPVDRRNLKSKLPYFVLSILFGIVALFGKEAQATEPLIPLFLSFVSIPFYLLKYFIPTNLSIFYPFTDTAGFFHPRILTGAVIIILITAIAWKVRKRTRFPLASWFFFLCMLAPSLTNVMKGGDAGSYDLYFASDRYVYLAGLGVLLFVGAHITERKWQYWLPIVILFGILGFRQAGTWRSSETLFRNAVAASSNSYVAYNNLGGILAQNKQYADATALFEESIRVKENHRALFNLGKLYAVQGRSAEAIRSYERVLTFRPEDANVYAQLGGLKLLLGDVEAAFTDLQKANALDPNIPSVHYNLGLIYEYRKQKENALSEYRRVLELDPADVQAQRKLGGTMQQ